MMLRIRKEQVAAFQPVAEAEFALRIVEHLRAKHAQTIVRLGHGPTLVGRLSDPSLLELVQAGVERARSRGLTWASSISGFVVLMFKAAPNFDQHPAIHELLADVTVNPEKRMQNILEKTSSSVWSEVMERYDPTAWQSRPKGARQ